MNTFWLKIAGAVVAVVGIIILVKAFLPKSEPEPQKTVYDVWQKDDKRLRAEPQLNGPAANSNQPVRPEKQQPVFPQATTVEPPKPQFKQLTEEQQIEAERILEMALAERKMSRLPGMTPKRMVDYCRQIIQKWPDSEYAFKAKRMLADIPERYHQMYNITKEEIDLGNLK
jgi:HJR/Mrr/RecB family endonuclease